MRCGTQDIGVGTKTIVAIITAETLGMPMDAVKAEIGDSNYPFSGGTGGSTTAPAVSPAIRVTAGKALEELKPEVAPALGVEATTLVASNGRIHVKGDPAKACRGRTRASCSGCSRCRSTASGSAGLSASGTSGVQFAEVEVDIETGVSKVNARHLRSGLRPDRQRAHRREPVHRRRSSAA